MKAAQRHIDEINRLKTALEKTNSAYLKNDYSKAIRRLQAELREYCQYRGFDYRELLK